MPSNLNSDFGYYNILINNGTNNFKKAEFSETRIAPVLTSMQDWQLGIVRFKIPSTSIPLTIFEDNGLPVDDPAYQSEYTLSIALSVNGVLELPISRNVIYKKTTEATTNPENRFVYYYSQFVDMVNDTLRLLWEDIFLAPVYTDALGLGDYNVDTPPKLELDDTTSYFKFILPAKDVGAVDAPQTIFDKGLPLHVDFIMNGKLFYYFSGFSAICNTVNPVLTYRLQLCANQGNLSILPTLNVVGGQPPQTNRHVNTVFQDYSNLYLWQTLSRLILTTTIPIEQELIGVGDGFGNNFQQTLLTDFEIVPNREGNQRDYIFYFPDEVRYSNFSSNGDLTHMDLRVFFQTRDLQVFPLEIPPGFELSVKIQFKRRPSMSQLQYSNVDSHRHRGNMIQNVGTYR